MERKNKPFNIDTYLTDSKPYLVNPDTVFPDPPPPASWEEVIYNNYWLAHHLRAVEVLRYGMSNSFNKKYLTLSKDLISELIKKRKNVPADYYKNVGIAHHHLERQSSGNMKDYHQKEMLTHWDRYLKMSKATTSGTYQKILSIVNAYNKALSQRGKMPASVTPEKK